MVEPVDRRSGSGGKGPEEATPAPEAQREAPQPEPQPTERVQPQGESHLPKPDFNLLLQMFFEQALFAMGRIPGLPESEQQVDLNLARFQIGLMEVLQEKTKGNLTQMEEKFLDEFLHQARLTYVTVQKQKQQG